MNFDNLRKMYVSDSAENQKDRENTAAQKDLSIKHKF